MTQMRAIVQRVYGDPDVLVPEDRLLPEPGSMQVRVAVAAAGVHLLDTVLRTGEAGPFGRAELPMTPGREVAGVVDAVGDDVHASWLGRRVVAHLGPLSGGYATHALAPVAALIPLADHVDPAEAVAMVGTGRTALGILERGRHRARRRRARHQRGGRPGHPAGAGRRTGGRDGRRTWRADR